MTPPENSEQRGSGGGDTPPWQRVAQDGGGSPAVGQERETSVDEYGERWAAGQLPADESTNGGYEHQAAADQTMVTGTAANRLFGGGDSGLPDQEPTARERVGMGTTGSRGRATPTALRRPGRGPRRASLQIKRFDPWSVLKLSLVLGLALFFVWLVAVGVLYTVLDGMGVWDKLNGTYTSLVQGDGEGAGEPLISVGPVFGVAAVVGAINIVLISALATVSAFIYNVSADLAGGLEVTLSERE
ncbi:Transmembrane protein of unknown function [Amycolatopsis marina]|uniref:DUF3566 domain-containing protein n=1 Tax=Amycolatopsis marina TaxID=490629 RepID=A0A1I0VZN2_9PSEU|nr:DUF3566 domain-containing protein [Amycolatopsis marina]SFA81390.1 Transmembrane protein of unknown function [Amycolatopsis marina]